MPSLFDRRGGFKPKKTRQQKSLQSEQAEATLHSTVKNLHIEKLSHEGRGVARQANGKTIFVSNALPDEKVDARVTETHNKFDEADAIKIMSASSHRQTPPCDYFSECGGCQLQHLSYSQQILFKQQQVEELLHKSVPNVKLPWSAPIAGEDTQFGYRRRLRLAIAPRQRAAGFRLQQSKQIVQIRHCRVAEAPLSDILEPLQSFLGNYPSIKYLGHIELNIDEQQEKPQVIVTARVTKPLTESQQQAWRTFEAEQSVTVVIQDNPADQAEHFYYLSAKQNESIQFHYQVQDESLVYGPNEFIQVNRRINEQMLKTIMAWLELKGDEKILELFAGFGNFSFLLGRHSSHVLAVEGAKQQVERGRDNMLRLGLDNVDFIEADLSEKDTVISLLERDIDVLVMDPPRAGAELVAKNAAHIKASTIVYVSCNPASLARDLKYLCHAGFNVENIAILDMFAQTSHAETVVLLKKSGNTANKD